jgi:hypothetical protein
MSKFLLSFYFILAGIVLTANTNRTLTQSFTITGKVKEGKKFTLEDLRKFTTHDIGDIAVSNHKGESKGTAKGLKGVLVRDVLETVTLETDNPKLSSGYYFVCKAADGYKAVYSWNELFNTATGESAYLVLEKEGKPMDGHEDNILMISSKDVRTGRRYVKNLETIIVGRVE